MQSTAPLATLDAPWLVDWAGAQRWLLGDFDRAALTPIAERAGGHVTLYRRGERTDEVHHDLAEPLKALHLKLKSAFDPDRIFNPGRLYRWL
jgi:glycolate oxidase FAD binding subunit